jgi:Holliday junction resolvasome RuvABC endonuclease subunit
MVAGLDGSLRNFGIARMWLDTVTLDLSVQDLILIKTEKSKDKQVRRSSDYLSAAIALKEGCQKAMLGVTTAFYEVPAGGQDYNAVMGFGIVIGTYASLAVPGAEVSPGETKKAAVGTKTASKQEMIEWAMEKFPEAPWRTRKLKGEIVPTNDNEHLADAVAIVHAGIMTPSFKQTLAILNQSFPIAA